MKSDLDYWIEVDRRKERALKRLELEEREKQERTSEMIDIAQTYITRRLIDLDDMLDVYREAGQPEPVDLLARKYELARMSERLGEYEDVQEADS
jgi:hypothetical protein